MKMLPFFWATFSSDCIFSQSIINLTKQMGILYRFNRGGAIHYNIYLSTHYKLKRKQEKAQSTFFYHEIISQRLQSMQHIWDQFWQPSILYHFIRKDVAHKEATIVDAADSNDLVKLQTILNNNSLPFSVNQTNGLNNWAALHYAAFNNNVDMIKTLLHKGADVHYNSLFTPDQHLIKAQLNSTSCCNHEQVHSSYILASQIIQQPPLYQLFKDINTNIQDNDLNTPLHLATSQNLKNVVLLLLENENCNPYMKNKFSQQPLDLSDDHQMLQVYKAKSIQSDNHYSRTIFNNQVLKNSRFDHTQRLLSSVQNLAKMNTKIDPARLEFISKIGKGAFGNVYKVRNQSNHRVYALKTLQKSKYLGESIKHALQERDILKSLTNYKVKLIASFQTSEELILLMDYIEGEELNKTLKKQLILPEDEAAQIIGQLAVLLNQLHGRGIIFRDLKPQNVIMKDKKAYLVDFGLAKILKGEPYSYTFCGSYSYLAPEMINKKGHDESLDWYLLGLLTYQLLHGITPYYDNDLNKFFKKVVEGNLKISELVSTEGRKFICSLMKMDSFQRAGYLDIKASEFMKNVDFSQLEKEEYGEDIIYDSQSLAMNSPIDLGSGQIRNQISGWNWNV